VIEPMIPQRPRAGWLFLLPIGMFAALAGVFLYALSHSDPSKLPSALIGKPAPEFSLPGIEGVASETGAMPGLSSADLKSGAPMIVNVWASWCAPCRDEQPILGTLAKRAGVVLVGINYKDTPEDARRFLTTLGNPFTRIGADRSGRTAIDWGVFGVPETYVLNGQGTITYKHIGPISPTSIEADLLPAIERARQK
jgi:cytochrome c biogenesis protein CcmG, thiol:disulfide interchange protein DsbE